MPKDTDVPGNTLESQRLFDEMLRKTGRRVRELERTMLRLEEDGVTIKMLKLNCKAGPRGEWLAILTAQGEEGGLVAFHSADGLPEVLAGLSTRLGNGSLKWKEDEYAE